MKLIRIGPDSWGFTRLSEDEVGLLRDIRGAADTAGCQEAENRIYQKPLVDGGDGDEEEFLSDWDDFVTESFREQFLSAVSVVEADLINVVREAEEEDAADDGDGDEHEGFEDFDEEFEPSLEEFVNPESQPYFRLEIPIAHTEEWFGALNQARLVLSARYRLHQGDDESIGVEWTEEGPAIVVKDDFTGESVEDRVDAHFKNQAYGFVQEWLISEVMSEGLS